MSLKYKCQECGTPLGFGGLCWRCRAKKHREEVNSWTDKEIKEKINQVIERLKVSTEDNFYKTDEYEIFQDLMTRGIYVEEFSKTACEREIFYPSELYYKASSEVRDRLIEKILNTKSSDEGGLLLQCLAMIGDKKSQDTLYELKINPRPWRKKLYVDSDIYAEELSLIHI